MEYVLREDSIDLLGFDTRISNRLHQLELLTIGAYLDYPEGTWSSVRGLGASSIGKLIETKRQLLQGSHPSFTLMDANPAQEESAGEEPAAAPSERKTFIDDDGVEKYDILIEDLPFSVRAKRCLTRGGYAYASALRHISDARLLSIRNFGVTTVKNVRDVMRSIVWEPVPDAPAAGKPDADDLVLAEETAEKLRLSKGDLMRELQAIREKNPVIAGESLIYLLFSVKTVRDALEKTVLNILHRADEPVPVRSIEAQLPRAVRNTTILEDLLLDLEQRREITYSYDDSEDAFFAERRYPSIRDYINNYPENKESSRRQKEVLRRRIIDGETLESIGDSWGVTRERIRQIWNKAIKNKPRVEEDRYLPVYSKYYYSPEAFTRIYGCDAATFNYLNLVCEAPRNNKETTLADVQTDETIRPEIRREFSDGCNQGKLYLGGVYVPKNRDAILKHVMKTYCAEAKTVSEILGYYTDVLAEAGLEEDRRLTFNSESYLENRLSEGSYALSCGGHSYRYYNYAEVDADSFLRDVHLDDYRGMELSTLKILRDHPEIKREYRVKDEYELHNLLRKICGKTGRTDIDLSKMPTVTIGTASRKNQVQDLLFERAPITKKDFADAYEDLYGVKAATVQGSYLGYINDYLDGDTYRIDFARMPDDHVEKMRELLTEPVYRISDIADLYCRTYPDAPRKMVNAESIRRIGFVPQSNYYAYQKRYDNAADCFRHMLLDQDIVDESAFPRLVHSIGAYAATQMRLRKEREITDFLPGQFISIRRLEQIGVTRETLEAYCADVAKALPEGSIFTIDSLRGGGFDHELHHRMDDWGFGSWFYSSVLAADGRFSIRRLGDVRLIRNGGGDVQLSDLLADVLERERRFEIHELCEYLKEHYGITADKFKLVEIIRGTDLYYSDILETVYVDYDTYYEEV